MVYDAYVADQERQRTQEESNKAKPGAGKGSAAAGRETDTPRDMVDAPGAVHADSEQVGQLCKLCICANASVTCLCQSAVHMIDQQQ